MVGRLGGWCLSVGQEGPIPESQVLRWRLEDVQCHWTSGRRYIVGASSGSADNGWYCRSVIGSPVVDQS